jgi:hypothetical protein
VAAERSSGLRGRRQPAAGHTGVYTYVCVYVYTYVDCCVAAERSSGLRGRRQPAAGHTGVYACVCVVCMYVRVHACM